MQFSIEHHLIYRGGARDTQVGDEVIFELDDFNDTHGQPNKTPEHDGYYLHDEIVCDKCIDKVKDCSEKIKVFRKSFKSTDVLMNFSEKYEDFIEEKAKKIIDNWVNRLNLNDIRFDKL